MSKTDAPRPRYIALRLHGPALGRPALAQALRDVAAKAGWSAADSPQLTRFVWPDAIVRVEHDRAGAARRLLDGLALGAAGRITTVATSGTLKALTTRTGALRERGDKGPAKR